MASVDEKTLALLRQALRAQIELGVSEVILPPAQPRRRTLTLKAVETATPPAEDLFGRTSGGLGGAEFDSLDAHCAAICHCQNCPLGATRNKFVYGVGNPNADLLFIGEGPGADEDRIGEPFVGRAGKLLDQILAAIQLSRQQVYIANIVKCRPPGNRDPLPNEMEQCRPYLKEQVRLIKPKLICALGRVAAQALLGTTRPLGKLRNTWQDFYGIPVLVTYHPAALLRFQEYKRDTWEDMKLLRTRYDQLKS